MARRNANTDYQWQIEFRKLREEAAKEALEWEIAEREREVQRQLVLSEARSRYGFDTNGTSATVGNVEWISSRAQLGLEDRVEADDFEMRIAELKRNYGLDWMIESFKGSQIEDENQGKMGSNHEIPEVFVSKQMVDSGLKHGVCAVVDREELSSGQVDTARMSVGQRVSSASKKRRELARERSLRFQGMKSLPFHGENSVEFVENVECKVVEVNTESLFTGWETVEKVEANEEKRFVESDLNSKANQSGSGTNSTGGDLNSAVDISFVETVKLEIVEIDCKNECKEVEDDEIRGMELCIKTKVHSEDFEVGRTEVEGLEEDCFGVENNENGTVEIGKVVDSDIEIREHMSDDKATGCIVGYTGEEVEINNLVFWEIVSWERRVSRGKAKFRDKLDEMFAFRLFSKWIGASKMFRWLGMVETYR